MLCRLKADSEFLGRINDLERDFQELAKRLLLLPSAEMAEHVKLTINNCSDALKKSLQALPPRALVATSAERDPQC